MIDTEKLTFQTKIIWFEERHKKVFDLTLGDIAKVTSIFLLMPILMAESNS